MSDNLDWEKAYVEIPGVQSMVRFAFVLRPPLYCRDANRLTDFYKTRGAMRFKGDIDHREAFPLHWQLSHELYIPSAWK